MISLPLRHGSSNQSSNCPKYLKYRKLKTVSALGSSRYLISCTLTWTIALKRSRKISSNSWKPNAYCSRQRFSSNFKTTRNLEKRLSYALTTQNNLPIYTTKNRFEPNQKTCSISSLWNCKSSIIMCLYLRGPSPFLVKITPSSGKTSRTTPPKWWILWRKRRRNCTLNSMCWTWNSSKILRMKIVRFFT